MGDKRVDHATGRTAAKGATPPCISKVCADERRNGSGRSATPHRPTVTDDCQSRGHVRCSAEPDDECARGHRVLLAVPGRTRGNAA